MQDVTVMQRPAARYALCLVLTLACMHARELCATICASDELRSVQGKPSQRATFLGWRDASVTGGRDGSIGVSSSRWSGGSPALGSASPGCTCSRCGDGGPIGSQLASTIRAASPLAHQSHHTHSPTHQPAPQCDWQSWRRSADQQDYRSDRAETCSGMKALSDPFPASETRVQQRGRRSSTRETLAAPMGNKTAQHGQCVRRHADAGSRKMSAKGRERGRSMRKARQEMMGCR